MAFIPLVGAMTGGLIITAISLIESWQSAAVFAAMYFVYLQIEAYVVSPRVMARAVAVPAAVAVIAVIAGGTVLGVLGALMAIPTAAAIMLLVREIVVPYQDHR
jgi:predicted PurR-regulated permease PerM